MSEVPLKPAILMYRKRSAHAEDRNQQGHHVQGNLAHKKPPPPRTLEQDHA